MRIICFFFISSLLYSQNQNMSFYSVTIQPGLPEKVTFFEWENASFVNINSGVFYEALFLVSKDSFISQNECFLFEMSEEGSSLSQVFFNLENNEAVINLKTEDEDLLTPLRIKLELPNRAVFYRWEDNLNNLEVPTVKKEYELKRHKVFPKIEIETTDGKWTNENKKKIIVINWWATSCIPCVEEMPGLNKLVEKHSNKEIEFVAIVADKINHSDFIKKHTFNYLQCYGNENTTILLCDAYPRNIIIDKSGVIIYNQLGASKETYMKLDSIIQEIL